MGWAGKAVGFLLGRLSGKRESLANKIEKVQKLVYETQNKRPFTKSDHYRLKSLMRKLSELERQAKNN